MSQLHQIQLKYVAVEDRALMRVSTQSRQEFRFWVTRRYAAIMLSALAKNLEAGPIAVAQCEPERRSAVIAFEREAALTRSDFETRFQDPPSQTPLGETPVLLARLAVRRVDPTTTLLGLHPSSGQGIEVRLGDSLIHSLIKLLEDAARAGSWSLPPAVTASASGAGPGKMN